MPGAIELDVPRFQQPDDLSCGPTCLLQVLRHYGDDRPPEEVVDNVDRNDDGGTLAVFLGLAACRLGYSVRLFSYDLRIFDPTWVDLAAKDLSERLRRREGAVRGRKLARAVRAHRELMAIGGEIAFVDLSPALLVEILARQHPVVCGLSATYLYRTPRERPEDDEYDDIRGEPVGHFVVVCGQRDDGREFLVSDPSPHSPFSETGRYSVPAQRLLNAILLGDLTNDAVLIEVGPRTST